jgi:hypothetical protein
VTNSPRSHTLRRRPGLRRFAAANAAVALLLAGAPLVASSAGALTPHPSFPVYPALSTIAGYASGLAVDGFGNVCVSSQPYLVPDAVAHNNIVAAPGSIYGVDTNGLADQFVQDPLLVNPWGEAIGPDGYLYVVNTRFQFTGPVSSGAVVRVAPNGTVTPFVTFGPSAGVPQHIAFGPDGNLYVGFYESAPGGFIDKVTMGGVVSLFKDDVGPGFAFDSSGRVFAADDYPSTNGIDIFNLAGAKIGALAVTSSVSPVYVALGASGNAYFTDQYGAIWRVTPSAVLSRLTFASSSNVRDLAFTDQGDLLWTNGPTGVVNELRGVESGQGGYFFSDYDCGPPTSVTNLKVTRALSSVTATWDPVEGARYLCVLTYGTAASSVTIVTGATTCTFKNLNPLGSYGVQLYALTVRGQSPMVFAPAPAPKIIMITCVKGKVVKHVRGVSPRCPIGFRRR